MLTHTGTQMIETKRLILRCFDYLDSDTMLKNWIADENVQSLYAEPVYTTKNAVNKLLDTYISSYEKKDYYRWAIILKENNDCIGQIAYFLVNSDNHFAEIEYCIGSNFQKKGFATEATKAIIDFGFNTMNLHKIQISHKSMNIPSQRVIEKCGFKYEGTWRDFFFVNGEYIDRLYYSILKDEFK
ncbi:MAG: GNAT family protein [Coprobacillus sp.]